MREIEGKYTIAKVFSDIIDESAIEQIQNFCNNEVSKDSKVRVMPDVHAGSGCTIGFTSEVKDKVIPNIVGVDIGCGMITVKLGKVGINLEEVDNIIRKNIPSGKSVHEVKQIKYTKLLELYCYRELKDTKRIERSLGTLGGGNHFIEINIDDEGNKYLVIHSGSRNLGIQVASYYQNLAYELHQGKDELFEAQAKLIKEYKENGKRKELQNAIKQLKLEFKAKEVTTTKELCYLKGQYKEKYIHDMKITQEYANLNRKTMANIILERLFNKKLEDFQYFQTIHNYIDTEEMIVRKGAVSAKLGEEILIPINMRDGSLICIGKGNEDWNFSAPHGAGRLFSRNVAKSKFTTDEFIKSMKGIFTTSVNENTLDECPMAYKDINHILNNIIPTAEVIKIIKPIYNFKAN